jgi:hypothetical protein
VPDLAALVRPLDPVLDERTSAATGPAAAKLGVAPLQDVRGDLPDRLLAEDRVDVVLRVAEVVLAGRLF